MSANRAVRPDLCDESQRLMHLLHGGTCDRPPFYEPWFGMGQMLREEYGGSYVTMAEQLGHAAVPIWGFGTGVDFEVDHEPTEAGAYYAGGALRHPEQLHQRAEPDYASQIDSIKQRLGQAHAAGRATWSVLGWCFDRMAASMGLEQFAMNCYDRPDFVHEAMEWVEQRNRNALQVILPHVQPDFFLYNGDCAYKTGTMVSPQMLREFTYEPTMKTVELIRDAGIPLAFHTDGKLDDVIPLLLDFGVAAVHGCEKMANDLGHLVDRFGSDIALCGNMDVVFLTHASEQQVREETRAMLEIGSAKGRFIAGCNTSPKDYIPPANYRAMLDEVAKFARR